MRADNGTRPVVTGTGAVARETSPGVSGTKAAVEAEATAFLADYHADGAFQSAGPLDAPARALQATQTEAAAPDLGIGNPRLFSQAEFPNYFLGARTRDLSSRAPTPARALALTQELSSTRRAVEAALGKIFENLTMPIVGETGELENVRIFPYLQERLPEIDDSARLQPSGGVVRSTLGLLYHELREAALEDPSFEPLVVLQEIAEGRHPLFNAAGEVTFDQIRGMGSDFDLLVDTAHPERFEDVERLLGDVVNSASRAFVSPSDQDSTTKAVFPVGDIKANFPRAAKPGQTERSVAQGGSTLDFLCYDLKSGKLREPAEHPGIVRDFLRGVVTYAPASGPRENHPATVLRGVRALLELPFLRLEGEEVLGGELDTLIAQARRGDHPNEKALEQLSKMFRNARESGGNNRVHRSAEDHPLSKIQELVSLLQAAQARGELSSKVDLDLPTYARLYPLNRSLDALPEWLSPHVLRPEQFVDGYLEGGRINHGTKLVDWALSILRGGFRETVYEKGIRRGTYTSPLRTVSQGYVGSSSEGGGLLLEMNVREGVRPNVLDARRIGARIEERLKPEAEAAGLEVADLLAAKYGFDVILLDDHEMLLKNPAIVEPLQLQEIVRSIGTGLSGTGPLDRGGSQQFLSYRRLHPYVRALGHGDLPDVPRLEDVVERLFAHFDPTRVFDFLMSFYDLSLAGQLSDEDRAKLNGFVAEHVRWTDLGIDQFWSHEFGRVLSPQTLETLLSSPEPRADDADACAKFMYFVTLLEKPSQARFAESVQKLLTPAAIARSVLKTQNPKFALMEFLWSSVATEELKLGLVEHLDETLSAACEQGDGAAAISSLDLLFSAIDFTYGRGQSPAELSSSLNAGIGALAQAGKIDWTAWRSGRNDQTDGIFLLNDSLADGLIADAFEQGRLEGRDDYGYFFVRMFDMPEWSERLSEALAALLRDGLVPDTLVPRLAERLPSAPTPLLG